MFSHKLVKALNLGKRNMKNEPRESSSILAIISNGKNQLFEKHANIKEELLHLINISGEHYDRYDVLCYQNDNKVIKLPIADGDKHINPVNTEACKPTKVSTDESMSDLECEDNSMFKTIMASASDYSTQPLYTFIDKLRDVTYSMIIEGEVPKSTSLLRLSGFVDWLDINNSETLDSTENSDKKYIFLWLVKCIQGCNGDVVSGMNRGLSVLGKNNIGGHFNVIFSDGKSVCAYSNQSSESFLSKKLIYRISRNVQNICSYTIKSSHETPGLGWSDIKTHNLYCFPSQGAMQVYANIDTNQYSDNKFRTGVNWVCLSLLSC